MKKLKHGFVLVLTIFAVLCPMVVKADLLDVRSEIYSKTAVVGSEVTYSILVGERSFAGVVTFDSSVLEVVSVKTLHTRYQDVATGSEGTITKSVDGNKLNIDYKVGDYPVDLIVTFKVKSSPGNGQTTVSVVANDETKWFGESKETIAIDKEKECSVCEDNEVNCPVCEKCESTNSNNDTLLYVSFGVSAVLAVAVVALALSKKH